MGGREFESNSMKMGKKPWAEFVPLGIDTVTYVRLQASGSDWKIRISAYWDDSKNCREVTD